MQEVRPPMELPDKGATVQVPGIGCAYFGCVLKGQRVCGG